MPGDRPAHTREGDSGSADLSSAT